MSGSNLWESLYAQTPPNSITSSSQDFQSLPAWFQDYQKSMLKYAAQATPANMPLYQGNRQADLSDPAVAAKVQGSFSPQERQAFSAISGMQGQYAPWITQGADMTRNAAMTSAASGIDNFLNPYINDVNNNLAFQAGRNLNEYILPGIQDSFIAAGQMSGTRMGEFTNRAVRDTQEGLMRQQSDNLASGFNTALGASQSELNRQMTGGEQLAGLASTGQQYGLTDAGALASVGQSISGKAQQGADIAYQDFQDQLNWPVRNIGVLNSALRGTTAPTSSTSYGTQPVGSYGTSPLTNLLATGYSGLGYKKGGRVKRKGALCKLAEGGQPDPMPAMPPATVPNTMFPLNPGGGPNRFFPQGGQPGPQPGPAPQPSPLSYQSMRMHPFGQQLGRRWSGVGRPFFGYGQTNWNDGHGEQNYPGGDDQRQPGGLYDRRNRPGALQAAA